MLKIKPQILFDERNRQRGVILKPRDFKRLIELLEDYDDYKEVIKRTAVRSEEYISHEEMGKILFGK